MSWGAQNRSKDAKTPSASRGRSDKPEPGLWPIQPYLEIGQGRQIAQDGGSPHVGQVSNPRFVRQDWRMRPAPQAHSCQARLGVDRFQHLGTG
jgi:hypothetical protein